MSQLRIYKRIHITHLLTHRKKKWLTWIKLSNKFARIVRRRNAIRKVLLWHLPHLLRPCPKWQHLRVLLMTKRKLERQKHQGRWQVKIFGCKLSVTVVDRFGVADWLPTVYKSISPEPLGGQWNKQNIKGKNQQKQLSIKTFSDCLTTLRGGTQREFEFFVKCCGNNKIPKRTNLEPVTVLPKFLFWR